MASTAYKYDALTDCATGARYCSPAIVFLLERLKRKQKQIEYRLELMKVWYWLRE